jgi:hypothetical protein
MWPTTLFLGVLKLRPFIKNVSKSPAATPGIEGAF